MKRFGLLLVPFLAPKSIKIMTKVDRKMRTFPDIVFERLLFDFGSILASILNPFLNIFAAGRVRGAAGKKHFVTDALWSAPTSILEGFG